MPSNAAEQYVLFDTAIGVVGIAWNERGLTRLQLPQADRSATERRVRGRGAQPCAHPPPHIERVIADIRRYATGTRVDFSSVAVDMSRIDAFCRQVYAAARAVGWGEKVTYGELARRAGCEGRAREVGQALARNPVPLIVPCHRIVAAGNRLGGFSAPGGTFTKERLLTLEGAFADAPSLPGILQ